LEFHIPYFALRKSSRTLNPNENGRNKLGRRTGIFSDKFTRRCKPDEQEVFHETQVSVLLVGIDEWVWTLYLVETHFQGAEEREDLEKCVCVEGDAPSGRAFTQTYPVWNPREYFLLVLCRRMDQATLEWRSLVETLEQRLRELVGFTSPPPLKKSLLVPHYLI
jgi:hypothetical protein